MDKPQNIQAWPIALKAQGLPTDASKVTKRKRLLNEAAIFIEAFKPLLDTSAYSQPPQKHRLAS